MPDHALEFMAKRKGVGCWVGLETQPEIEVWSPPPVCTGSCPFPQSSEGAHRRQVVSGARC